MKNVVNPPYVSTEYDQWRTYGLVVITNGLIKNGFETIFQLVLKPKPLTVTK